MTRFPFYNFFKEFKKKSDLCVNKAEQLKQQGVSCAKECPIVLKKPKRQEANSKVQYTLAPDFSVISIISVALGVIWGVMQGGTASDLVWFMWGSSLTGGFAFILFCILSEAVKKSIYNPEFPKIKRSIMIGVFGAIAFFAFHFGMFHFVHAQMLMVFFPYTLHLSDYIYLTGFGFLLCWQSYRSFEQSLKQNNQNKAQTERITIPYISVIKMHLLIFILAFVGYFFKNSLFLYIFVYAWFFVPVKFIPVVRKDEVK